MRACNCARASPFQSRTCEGCDPQLSIRQTMRISFNPCIRVGCDFRTRGEDGTSVPVSIHAPAWGATPSSMALMASATVFQSTHPRGVRQGSTSGFPNGGKFQSTHPRGVRPQLGSVDINQLRVSIHAPAWGATRFASNRGFTTCSFNPRTRVGCDFRVQYLSAFCYAFQSTHPRGVRHTGPSRHCCKFGFQSTHPRGVRPFALKAENQKAEFQSTHPRGVRLAALVVQGNLSAVSIHAPAWGATNG